MSALVAVVAWGPEFAGALTRVWEAGDAVLPVDPRLPAGAVTDVLEAMAPAWLCDPRAGSGTERRAHGRPAAAGDALVVATSGTTGTPKGVVLTHAAVAASARATSARLGVDPNGDEWIACLPLAHVGGLSVLTRAVLTGTPCAVTDGFDAAEVAAVAASMRARGRRPLVSLVATALARVDPGAFGVIVLGGSAPPPTVPPNAVVTYGMTETGSGVVYDGVALDGVEVRIEAGEIWLRGPMLARAYRTAEGESPLVDGLGWLATGDAGTVGPDGRLAVSGRLAEVIVTGGEKVWPAPVEAALRHHAGVADVAVVGAPDETWGQRVVAVVEASDPDHPPSLAALRETVRERLAPYAAPRQLVVVAALPRTALGKVRRQALGPLVEAAQSEP